MKKVLFMLSSMNVGGVEKSFLSLLSTFPKNQYKVTLLLLEKKGDFLELIPNWVKIEEVEWYTSIKPIIMQSPHQTVKGYLKNLQPQRVPGFITAYLLSKYLDDRYTYYEHVIKNIPNNKTIYDIAISYQGPTDIIDFYIANKVEARKKISWVHFDVSKYYINKNLYLKLYSKFDQLNVVSKLARKELINLFPSISNKVKVFPNIVETRVIQSMSKEIIEFDDNYKGIKILTVGRLSVEKGQDFAILALSKLRKLGYDVRWYCIGEGKYREQLEVMVKEHNLEKEFVLLGSTSNPYPYIAKADIYVQTSRHEGYCLTLAEAKCLAKPIVTTNFIGAYEQIRDGENGFIVQMNDKEIYRGVKNLIDNSEIRRKFSENLSKKGETLAKVFEFPI
ncbi:glycosyltransferase [Mesobacillus foraminis]|uniref:Glycosyltransferase involved in cell wall biosynthesis n=1 Tax=Mesobacillus foraminis TaxID=279826 RepID=A0A4R2B628_9BACI|nr:glycosyltransferase [Mesobacillus foraminis]TCN22201.1 glycosyltransferase involved in cell wall biosynthesis [Mesobacillus foraminis]